MVMSEAQCLMKAIWGMLTAEVNRTALHVPRHIWPMQRYHKKLNFMKRIKLSYLHELPILQLRMCHGKRYPH